MLLNLLLTLICGLLTWLRVNKVFKHKQPPQEEATAEGKLRTLAERLDRLENALLLHCNLVVLEAALLGFPVLLLGAKTSYSRHGMSYVACVEPVLQTCAVLVLSLPIVLPPTGGRRFRKLDVNPFFQIFSFIILNYDTEYPHYLQIHLNVSLLALLACLVYKFLELLPELKATVGHLGAAIRRKPGVASQNRESQTDAREHVRQEIGRRDSPNRSSAFDVSDVSDCESVRSDVSVSSQGSWQPTGVRSQQSH